MIPGPVPHDPRRCADHRACPLHRPTEHHLRGWPMAHEQAGPTYRLCPHGVAHPDPDDPWQKWDAPHECDGCCAPPPATGIALDVGGVVLGVRFHNARHCDGEPCPMHDPSDHPLRDAPVLHGTLIPLTIRRCPHGVLHPDPDDRSWGADRAHDCDGCCVSPSGR